MNPDQAERLITAVCVVAANLNTIAACAVRRLEDQDEVQAHLAHLASMTENLAEIMASSPYIQP